MSNIDETLHKDVKNDVLRNKDDHFHGGCDNVTQCHVIANLKFDMWFINNRRWWCPFGFISNAWFKWTVGSLSVNRNSDYFRPHT